MSFTTVTSNLFYMSVAS